MSEDFKKKQNNYNNNHSQIASSSQENLTNFSKEKFIKLLSKLTIKSTHIISQHLNELIKNTYVFKEINSTNKFLINKKNETNSLSIAITDFQTDGQGRGLNTWNCSKKTGILMSINLPIKFEKIVNWKYASQIMALAIIESIQENYKVKLSFKWPNDIVFCHNKNYKKISGILAQSTILGNSNQIENNRNYLVLGMGFNVFDPKIILDKSKTKTKITETTYLEQIRTKDKSTDSLDRETILALIIHKFFDIHTNIFIKNKEQLIRQLRQHSILNNQNVIISLPPRNNPITMQAKFIDISDNGNAIIVIDKKHLNKINHLHTAPQNINITNNSRISKNMIITEINDSYSIYIKD